MMSKFCIEWIYHISLVPSGCLPETPKLCEPYFRCLLIRIWASREYRAHVFPSSEHLTDT
jgi:hypothetical protein